MSFVYSFKNEVSQKQCAEALAGHGVFTKIKKRISKYASNGQNLKITFECHLPFRKLFEPRIQQFLDPFSIILQQMDFLKDMLFVVRLTTLLGGIVVFTNPQLFSSNVSKYSLR